MTCGNGTQKWPVLCHTSEDNFGICWEERPQESKNLQAWPRPCKTLLFHPATLDPRSRQQLKASVLRIGSGFRGCSWLRVSQGLGVIWNMVHVLWSLGYWRLSTEQALLMYAPTCLA